jgi:fructose-bisphosphate aldolase class II
MQCRAWQPVQHVIIYNVESGAESRVDAMMARGAETLAAIPGVRRVVTGWAVSEQPRFRYCWIVEFAHKDVIASYREHPEHLVFANRLFRPIAGDRISIDFAEVDYTAHDPVPDLGRRAQL